MADDVITPSNPLVALIEEEELKKSSLDVNVSQWSHKKEPPKKMVHIWVDCSTWDHQLSPNPHALKIYLEFVLTYGTTPKRSEKC